MFASHGNTWRNRDLFGAVAAFGFQATLREAAWKRHSFAATSNTSLSMMSSSESPEDLRPAEDLLPAEAPLYFRKRKVSKTILDALGVSCQVAPSTAGEVALLKVDPAVAADVVAESDVAVTIASPTTDEAAVVTPVGVPMSTGLPPRFEFSDKFERHERKFVLFTCGVCLVLMAGCVIASVAAPTTFGEFYPAIATNFAIIFLAEVVWRALLSCVAYRYASRFKRTINYTRKLGNCFKLYKLFVFGEPKPKPKPEPSPHPPAL